MLDRHLSPYLACLLLALALTSRATVLGPADACGQAVHALRLRFNASPGLLLQGRAHAKAEACSRAWAERAESQELCPADSADARLGLALPGLGRIGSAAMAFRSQDALWLLWLKPSGGACDWVCLQLRPRPGKAELPLSLPLPPGSCCVSSLRELPAGPACYCIRCPGPPERSRAWLSPQLQGRGWQNATGAWQALPWALERAGQRLLIDLGPSSGAESQLTLMATSPL
jgi:hypothetical protein